MSEQFINALREAIQEIAETMLFVDIVALEATKGRSNLSADVSAVVGYSSALKGSMRLAGPQASAVKLAGALLGEERDAMDKEMEDSFSEMANMIAGGVQTRIETGGMLKGHIRMSPPVIISGTNHQVSSDRSFECVSHQFDLDGNTFFAEIYYSRESLENGPDEDDDETKYGFSLTIPMPTMPGSGTRDRDRDDEGEEEPPKKVEVAVDVNEQAVRKILQEVCMEKLEAMARETAQSMASDMLPEIAERLVREEIERIKRDGL
jgi:chemotaxis protein CheX